MTDDDLAARLRAVERAVTDGDASVVDLSDAAAVHDRLDELERDIGALAERMDALDATVQSLHGYVGELEHVNERVERRADAARAAVERFEDDRRRPGSVDGSAAHASVEQSERGGQSGQAASRSAERRPVVEDGDSVGDNSLRGDTENSLLDRVRDSL